MADQLEVFTAIERWRAGVAEEGKAIGLRIVDRKGNLHCLAMSPNDADRMSIRLSLLSAEAKRMCGDTTEHS